MLDERKGAKAQGKSWQLAVVSQQRNLMLDNGCWIIEDLMFLKLQSIVTVVILPDLAVWTLDSKPPEK